MALPDRIIDISPSPMPLARVVNRRENGLIDAYLPVDSIYTEDVAVDFGHVEDLKASIQSEESKGKLTGQLMPILVGEVPNIGQFPIMDGFHRLAALRLLERPEVFSTIRVNSSWEEVLDLRIVSAATHKSVRFARIVDWVEQAWKFTPWADRVRVTQAFTFNFVPDMTGRKIGLQPEEVEQIQDWVERKCEQWHLEAGTIYTHLKSSQGADPQLVKAIRESIPGRERSSLTPIHLDAITQRLPFDYDYQRLVAEAAAENRLTVKQISLLADAVKYAPNLKEATSMIRHRLPLILEETRPAERNFTRQPRQEKVDPVFIDAKRAQAFDEYYKWVEATARLREATIAEIIGKDMAGKVATELQAQLTLGLKQNNLFQQPERPEFYTTKTPYGELVYYPDRLLAVSPLQPEGTMVELTRIEGKILEKLISNPTMVFSSYRLTEAALRDFAQEIQETEHSTG